MEWSDGIAVIGIYVIIPIALVFLLFSLGKKLPDRKEIAQGLAPMALALTIIVILIIGFETGLF